MAWSISPLTTGQTEYIEASTSKKKKKKKNSVGIIGREEGKY
jgi:hypothetical protein